jgi:hypothetical protein
MKAAKTKIARACVNCRMFKRQTMTPLNRSMCAYWGTWKYAAEVACSHYEQWEKANNTAEGSATR